MQFLQLYNKQLILLSVMFAILFGMTTPLLFPQIKFLGDIFINLLRLFALPLICSALIAALGGLSGKLSSLKTLSKHMIFFMLFSEVCAVTIALFLFNFFIPGIYS